MKLRLSARRSDLARLQAYRVGQALQNARPGLEIEYQFKESLGDKNLTDPLWKLPQRGVFTEDFVEDLRSGLSDLVVHSWKDLPTEERPGLEILGTLPRADLRDLLLLRQDAIGKKNLTLLTSSPRRELSLRNHLPALLPFPIASIETKPVRGNIATRLRKLLAGEGDGLLMAKAALDRMLTAPEEEFAGTRKEMAQSLAQLRWMVLPLSLFPTAPAQGALAIEAASGREDLRTLVRAIHCEATARAVEQERKRFSSFGGGCHQKIGLSVLPHSRLGWVEYFYGQPAEASHPSRSVQFGKNLPARGGESHWPAETAEIFSREAIAGVKNPGGNLIVARASALPEGWQIGAGQLIWAAGLKTWQALAKRGIWVQGSDEGLGESSPPLEALAGLALSWTKLTHEDSENSKKFPLLATYRLQARDIPAPPLVKFYFWASESQFRWALAQNPAIRGAQHAAGPGYTAAAIEKELGQSIEVYYNYSHWKTGNAYESYPR